MNHVAIDVGASGGTVYLGTVTQSTFDVTEVSRFDVAPVRRDGRYIWDVDTLRERLIDGLQAADDHSSGVDVVGIDTFGVDFGLVADGHLLRPPLSYRDPDVTATREQVFDTVSKRRIFDATGITNWTVENTLLQLHTLVQEAPELIDRADTIRLMPQLLTGLLGGETTCETTIASTTQMVDPDRRAWATDLLEALSIPTDLLPPLAEPGDSLGPVADDVAARLSSTPDLVNTASHDTAAAVAALPLSDDAAFLSTGTWFILGVERAEPLVTDAAYDAGFSNELGVDGTVRLLRNVDGFFLLESCREAWAAAGEVTEYDRLLAAAGEAPERAVLVDPDADSFGIGDSMPTQIRHYCRRTDQPVPTDPGEVVRCILDSLVTKTALRFEELASAVAEPPTRIHLCGGGVRNGLFCSLLADATGCPVTAGPVEATAIGNLLVQAVAVGEIPDVETGRELVAASFTMETYEPTADAEWEDAKQRMRALRSE
jgi:rhamnulokinase